MNNNLLTSQAEAYLQQLDQIAEEIFYSREQFREHLNVFQRKQDFQSRIDLQGSIAHFEKYLLPLLIQTRQDYEITDIQEQDVFSIGIDGDWKAYEFRQLFNSIDYFNKVYVMQTKLQRNTPDVRLRQGRTRSYIYREARLYYYLSIREELRVQRVQFASPGYINFEGDKAALEKVKDTVQYAITQGWVKMLVDNFFSALNEQLSMWKAESKARQVEAILRETKAREQIEAHSNLKKAIAMTRNQLEKQAPHLLEQASPGLANFDSIADAGIQFEQNKLVSLPVFERNTVNQIGHLNRVGYEQEKVKPNAIPPNKSL